VGFLIALKHSSAWEQAGLPEDFTFVFTEDDASYFKNTDMRNLDVSIGDIDSYIKDAEALIVSELEEVILDSESQLRDTFNALADLDCILAFASCAVDQKYVRPVVVPAEERCIRIKNGRHPLQEIIIESEFIPNDANIDNTSRVNIVTGPNFSGKSCYARQIGLLTYMAHIGCFLPCEAAQISVVDQILARFSSAETCAVPQSSFQLDLTSMGAILRRSGPMSLVIVDEFGKGTSPASGIALLTAALRSLASRGCKVVCTTHFLEIFSMGFLQDGESGIRALRMAVQVPQTTKEEPAPLFKLETGVASSSAGLVCAKMAGIKQAVIDRANEIVEATRERRRVQPLAEILRDHLSLSQTGKEVIPEFLVTNWKDASDDDIHRFLSRVSQM
jgi:DNA mismatch repair protein MSH5